MRPLALLACLPALAGCESVTVKHGDETLTATALFTKLNLAVACAQYDESGNLLSQTSQNFGSEGDAQALAAAGSLFGSVLGGIAKFFPVPAPLARQGALPSPPRSPAVAMCNGERAVRTPETPKMLESHEP